MVHGLSVFSLQLCQAHFKMILTDKPTIRATGGKNEKKSWMNAHADVVHRKKNKSFGLYKISCAWIYHQCTGLLKEFRIRHRIRSEPPAEIVVRFPTTECLPLEYICRIFHEKKRWRICNNISFKMVTFF